MAREADPNVHRNSEPHLFLPGGPLMCVSSCYYIRSLGQCMEHLESPAALPEDGSEV